MTTPQMTLADAVTHHRLVLEAEGRSPATLRVYLHYERKFLEYLDTYGITSTLDALNTTNVRAALEWLRAQPRSDSTRNGEVAAKTFIRTLKTWSNFLEAEGLVSQSLISRIKPPRVAKHLRQP